MGINRWEKVLLKTLCNRIGDGLHGTPKYSDNSDIFFINGNNLVNGKILVSKDTKKVPDFEWHDNFIELNKNSLLLSINGTIGEMAFYNDEKVMLGKSVAYLNFKTGINIFYYYYFQLRNIQKYFYQVATGSTIKNLGLKSIQEFEVPYPNIKSWEPITRILCELDKKIEINNKINLELEATAKTIYNYWFVQFDFPDENGNPYKSSGGKMVYNEDLKRDIPEGWNVDELQSIATSIMGHSPSGESYNSKALGMPLLNGPADYKNGALFGKTYTTSPTRVCKKDDMVLCIRATIGNLVYSEGEFCLGRGVAAVRPHKEESSELIYFLLQQEIKRFKIQAMGSIIKGIIKDDLVESKCLIPNENVVLEFHKIAKPMFNKQRKAKTENLNLIDLRDWLLPMLMNGQVKI